LCLLAEEVDPLQHLSRAGSSRRESLAKRRVLPLKVGQPELEVECPEIGCVAPDDGFLEHVALAAMPGGGELPDGPANDAFQLSKGGNLRPNAV
jgi:hypothetical protein